VYSGDAESISPPPCSAYTVDLRGRIHGIDMTPVVCRRVAVALAAFVAVVATSTTAFAAFALSFERSSASSGSRILVHTIGKGSCRLCPSSVPLFFVPAESVDTVQSRDDPLLTPIGTLRVNSDGDGAGTIVVPPLTPGGYMVMAHCEPCAATSAGRELLPVGPFPNPFELTSGRASLKSPTEEAAESPIVPIVLAAGFAALAGSLLWVRRRHRDREAPGP
jgi:hypothetical protein